jgi:hypothetical protein
LSTFLVDLPQMNVERLRVAQAIWRYPRGDTASAELNKEQSTVRRKLHIGDQAPDILRDPFDFLDDPRNIERGSLDAHVTDPSG